MHRVHHPVIIRETNSFESKVQIRSIYHWGKKGHQFRWSLLRSCRYQVEKFLRFGKIITTGQSLQN